MASLANLLILLGAATVLTFRLSRSYQWSFVTLSCSYLFLQSTAITLSGDWEDAYTASLFVCALLYVAAHRGTTTLLAKFPALTQHCALGVVCVVLAAHLSVSFVTQFPSATENYSVPDSLSTFQWLMVIGSAICAYCVYRRINPHSILIYGSSLFVALALYSLLLGQPRSTGLLLGSAGPWVWLILMRNTETKNWATRLLIALISAIAPLLHLTLPPALSLVSALPIIVAGAVCLSDILRYTKTQSLVIEVIPIAAWITALLALAVQLSFP